MVKNNVCPVCKCNNVECFHKGTRDATDIDIMICKDCSTLFCSEVPEDAEIIYEDSQMRQKTYNALTDRFNGLSWEEWCTITKADDVRRCNALYTHAKDKVILDFGCGNGGFLREMKAYAHECRGVELDNLARQVIESQGITCKKSITEYESNSVDIITMFHVMEHLVQPERWLKQIYSILKPGGLFICETPNAEDALIMLYKNENFKDFTFWSKHVCLYTSDSLEKLVTDNKFEVIENTQIQRYGLSNHMYWLMEGKPGGNTKLKELNSTELNKEYAEQLKRLKKCDTLFGIFKKVE